MSASPHSHRLSELADWFEDRTSFRAIIHALKDRTLPRGPRWSYATGACTLGLFLVVSVTGVLLMTAYSPAADHGWSSVQHIEATPGGQFLRGLHFYGSHALIVLFAIHLARAILHASFRAPRELAWISGVLLLPLLATQAVTGNPLTASNKAFGQIEVESHVVGNMPVMGPLGRRALLGGEDVGHLTMTHLYTLHVAVLPLLAVALLAFHLYQNLRFGTRAALAKEEAARLAALAEKKAALRAASGAALSEPLTEAEEEAVHPRPTYWPNQTVRNALVFALVFGVIAYLAAFVGSPLDAPADPSLTSMPRPEWYFRFLFELRNYFTSATEFIATGLLPGLFLGFLAMLPWLDRLLSRKTSVVARYAIVILAAAGWAALTAMSYARDREDPAYQVYLQEEEERSARAIMLAEVRGIPPDGPARLLRTDPLTRGPQLFERYCASCHPHTSDAGEGIVASDVSAPNLYGFASREWIAGLLDPERIAGPHYFGPTPFAEDEFDEMISYVRDTLYDVPEEELAQRKEEVRKATAALSAEAELPLQRKQDKNDAKMIAEGRELITGTLACTDCHRFGDAGELGSSPDLTGYGSREWLAAFISNPAHERFYGEKNAGMPAFAPEVEGSPGNLLPQEDLLLIVDWLRRDWPRVTAAKRLSQASPAD